MKRSLDEMWRSYDRACVPPLYSKIERGEAEVAFKNGIGAVLFDLANAESADREQMILDLLDQHSGYIAERIAKRFDDIKVGRR